MDMLTYLAFGPNVDVLVWMFPFMKFWIFPILELAVAMALYDILFPDVSQNSSVEVDQSKITSDVDCENKCVSEKLKEKNCNSQENERML